MENALLIGLSRQMAMSREMSVIANNIANMNTPGFKAETMLFDKYLMPNSANGNDRRPLAFVNDYGQHRDMTDGTLTATGNPLDVAITGDGFFKVQTEDGNLRYTRDGHFQLSATGQLITSNGDAVLTKAGGPISFTADEGEITISRDGTITTANGQRGQLGIVTFENPELLKKAGDNSFATDAEETPVDRPRLIQGSIEGSNVKPILEMTNMIEVMRSYASAQKLIDSSDEMRRKAISTLGAAA